MTTATQRLDFARADTSSWIGPGSLAWFAVHELRLSWRDWMSMMSGGKRTRERVALVGTLVFIVGLHLIAYALIHKPLAEGVGPSKPTLVLFSALGLLSLSLMLSQAIESITRAFYSRADLDLILSSPTSSRAVFTVRIGAIVLATAVLSLLLALPFVFVATWLDGARWLAVIPLIVSAAAVATAGSIVVTVAMFRTLGARRTRLMAQILAAVVGATFLIGTQIGAILSYGNLSRMALFSSDAIQAALPNTDSMGWLPAKAALGDPFALLIVVAVSFAALAVAVAAFAGRFGEYVLIAASLGEAQSTAARSRPLNCRTPVQALRAKEWRLLARDPWLISQTLMQMLYLIPPAVLLWRNYGAETGALVILAPVLVMAGGQLAGGLAWLAISGEDAPDLVNTAPIPPNQITIAKVQAVLSVVVLAAAPLLIAIAWASVWIAAVTLAFVLCSAGSAVQIQLWFRRQMSRSQFRRRQTASRTSTIAEAFSSILWAGGAAIMAAGSVLGLVFVVLALMVLAIAWFMRPVDTV